jgi:hypothetical protein
LCDLRRSAEGWLHQWEGIRWTKRFPRQEDWLCAAEHFLLLAFVGFALICFAKPTNYQTDVSTLLMARFGACVLQIYLQWSS